MRRLALLALVTLALAAPAGAQDGGRLRLGQAEPSSALRGPVGETLANDAGDKVDALAALVPMPPPVAPVGAVARTDSRQCRKTCNRDYYFCLSADEDICAPVWTKCTARCGRT